jgi:outer membrane protein, heavy metal efflux system
MRNHLGFCLTFGLFAVLGRCEAAAPPRATLGAPVAAAPAPPSERQELTVEGLVQQVLARNPSLAQMTAAYQAAVARFPQVTSLEDPNFGLTVGPATYGSSTVQEAYRLEISQKYPARGKLNLRGQGAQAEAAAAGNEIEDMKLRLTEAAKTGLYEYFLFERALEINTESLRLLREFRANAATRYEKGLATQQDILQADVEVGKEERRRLSLTRMRQVAIARINTLLNLAPDASLPPPPLALPIAGALPDAASLRASALARRPDLLALAQRIRAEQTAVALAYKEYFPDYEPFLMYDRFMGNSTASRPLAYMVGVRMNLPVRTGRRNALVAEAQAKLAQRRAEFDRQVNDVNFQVQEAYAQVVESRQGAALFETKILPAAEQNIRAAQTAYLTGKIPFLSLVEAQRNLIMLRDQYYESVSDYFRRLATLERVAGGF